MNWNLFLILALWVGFGILTAGVSFFVSVNKLTNYRVNLRERASSSCIRPDDIYYDSSNLDYLPEFIFGSVLTAIGVIIVTSASCCLGNRLAKSNPKLPEPARQQYNNLEIIQDDIELTNQRQPQIIN